jgi:spore coat protein CotF
MANMIGNMIKNTMDISDETIASSMLSTAKEAADMYLNATLTSNTPELRAIYSASLGQMVEGHTVLTELNVNKGWIKPYDSPIQQLADSYNESKDIINEIKE